MKTSGLILILCVLCLACSVKPEPLQYGVDACHTCKMTLVDRKFGAEIVTKKGKVFKFDDMNCMVNFLNSGEVQDRDVAYRLVVDFATPEKLIPAGDAFYVKSNEIRSPMASGIAAFESEGAMKEQLRAWKGIYLTWGELVTQFK
ncbi:MAG: nitrous oxide reductase accessory protein NosL [Bacteroidota bacterium]|jgi:copper chaperone NosL|nr:MAG: nitrous oxide reductase [Bacteroidota bacterium]